MIETDAIRIAIFPGSPTKAADICMKLSEEYDVYHTGEWICSASEISADELKEIRMRVTQLSHHWDAVNG